MSKKICVAALLAGLLALSGCSRVEVNQVNNRAEYSMFEVVERASSWMIVYHKQTKVMYAVSDNTYNHGNFTLLVDAEGKPLLYDGE